MSDDRMLLHGDPPQYWIPLSVFNEMKRQLAAAETIFQKYEASQLEIERRIDAAHALLREAVNACEDSYENMGGETIYSYDSEEISQEWFVRAKKEVGDE